MIHDLLKKRYSTRSFSDRKIEDEKILSLLEAAQWAPSSANEQPWRFIIAEKLDVESHQKIVDVLTDGNKIWAKNAPLLILTVTKLVSTHNNKVNKYSYYDIGTAAAHITFQATAMGLHVRQMGGFNPDRARAVFSIPESFAPVSVLAIGYKGEIDDLPVNLRERERLTRERKELTDIVFSNYFGEKSKLLEEKFITN